MIFQFFHRYFFSSRAGSVIRSMARICTIATFLGALALITVSSIMEGFNRSIRTKLLGVDPHFTVFAPQSKDSAWMNVVLQDWKSHPGVEMNPYAQQDVILRTIDGAFSGGVAKGLSIEALHSFLDRVHRLKFRGGQAPPLSGEALQLLPNEVLMGADLARSLNLFEGDELMVIAPESLLGPSGETPRLERMRIKDLVTTEFPEIDSKLIYYEMRPALRRFETISGRATGLEVRLKNVGEITSVQNALLLQYPDVPMTFESWTDRNRALFMALRLEKFAMTTFLFLSVLITCFSPITLLAMLISQKRKEIGLMMALGYSRQKVQRLFFRIGVILAGSGLFLGVGAGILVSWLLQKFPVEILPDIYYDTVLPSVINWGTVVWVAIFCSVVAVFAAFVPAYRSVLRDPSDNLRHQTGT